MTRDDDPLDDLVRAWARLGPPALLADADRDPADPRTRAAVDRLRAAWAELEAPPLPPGFGRGAIERGSGWLAPFAVAAVILLSVGTLWIGGRGADRPRAAYAERVPLERPDPGVVPDAHGNLCSRSGPVRLILIVPDPPR